MSFRNYDSHLYYRAARGAAQIEREGDYRRAALQRYGQKPAAYHVTELISSGAKTAPISA